MPKKEKEEEEKSLCLISQCSSSIFVSITGADHQILILSCDHGHCKEENDAIANIQNIGFGKPND